jgi:hypothetical protein
MKTSPTDGHDEAPYPDRPVVTGSHRRTLEAIFRHPTAHNLEWSDAVALIEKIGEVDRKSNNEFTFTVAGEQHFIRKPHTKDLTSSEVLELRQFLLHVGWSHGDPPHSTVYPVAAAPDLLVVVDHHEARIYSIDASGGDISKHEIGSKHEIRPYDPHHFLHHLTHKDQSRERGQRAHEDPSFYERIAQAVAAGGRIVVAGHGDGHSNAADHLIEYLRAHHRETYQRVVSQVTADLSSVTQPQLLEIAEKALL